MTGVLRRRHRVASATAALAIAGTLLTGYTTAGSAETAPAPAAAGTAFGDGPHAKDPKKEIALYTTLRELWGDHMQWTYVTVDAFFHNPQALQPSLDRLLRNQQDLGAAIVPYYGQAAGDQLAALLTTHIQQAVPVLEAAQAGDQQALQKALDDWYANAEDIADFLTAANPKQWPKSVTRPALRQHIDQTTVYATDLLNGDYPKAIKDYDAAFDHMMMLSDILSRGIIAQFPDKFCR
ncbi:hypothetical protein [Streptomyces fradiae]|uniref:hypothetical protein n=1 Tax=Streptomyces fradiae TaxID=1906 RepID=UPI003519CB95